MLKLLLIVLACAVYSGPIEYSMDGSGYIGPSFGYEEYTDEIKVDTCGLKIILRKETNTLYASTDDSIEFGIVGDNGEGFPIYRSWPIFEDVEEIIVTNNE